MVLHVHSDPSYLGEQKLRIRVCGRLFLISRLVYPSKQPKNTMNNDPLHTKCRVLSHDVASSAEAELGLLFHNGKPRYHCAPHSGRSSINNLQHQYKLTTPLHYAMSTPLSTKKSNVHDIILSQGLNTPRTILCLLGPSTIQQNGPFYQTSSANPSHSH